MNKFISRTLKISLCLCFLLPLFALAQIDIDLNRVKRRVENKVESRVNRKIDRTVDDVLDAAEDGIENKNKKNKKDKTSKSSKKNKDGNEEVQVEIEPDDSPYEAVPNEFVGTFQMLVLSFENGKEINGSPTRVRYTFDTWRTAMDIDNSEADQMVILVDLKDNTMTTKIDSDGSKQATKMKRPRYKATVQSKYTPDEIEITPTSSYDRIAGYYCRKYLVETPSQRGEVWVTDEINFDFASFSQTMQTSVKNPTSEAMANNIYGIEGFAMRTYMISKDGKEEVKMEVEDLEVGTFDESVFDLSGYKVMDMSSFGNY